MGSNGWTERLGDALRARASTPVPLAATVTTGAQLKVRATLAALERQNDYAAHRGVGMDTKASLLLVLSGIVTTVNFSEDTLIFRLSTVFALLTAGLAIVSLWPTKVKGIHSKTLSDRISGTFRNEPFSSYEFFVLELEVAAFNRRQKRIQARGVWLAGGFVASGAMLLLAGLGIFWGESSTNSNDNTDIRLPVRETTEMPWPLLLHNQDAIRPPALSVINGESNGP